MCYQREREEAKPQVGSPWGCCGRRHPTSGSPGSAYWQWVLSVSLSLSVALSCFLSPCLSLLSWRLCWFWRRRPLPLLLTLHRKGRVKMLLRKTGFFCLSWEGFLPHKRSRLEMTESFEGHEWTGGTSIPPHTWSVPFLPSFSPPRYDVLCPLSPFFLVVSFSSLSLVKKVETLHCIWCKTASNLFEKSRIQMNQCAKQCPWGCGTWVQ